jgi:hypothetical protein
VNVYGGEGRKKGGKEGREEGTNKGKREIRQKLTSPEAKDFDLSSVPDTILNIIDQNKGKIIP